MMKNRFDGNKRCQGEINKQLALRNIYAPIGSMFEERCRLNTEEGERENLISLFYHRYVSFYFRSSYRKMNSNVFVNRQSCDRYRAHNHLD